MTMSTTTHSAAASRTKRTHARRSCEVCKLRKTRCELPDVNVPSSSQPQPWEKSCHRCKTLSVACIVDDTGRKRGLPRESELVIPPPRGLSNDGGHENRERRSSRSSDGSPVRRESGDRDHDRYRRASRRSSGEGDGTGREEVQRDGRLLHGFDPDGADYSGTPDLVPKEPSIVEQRSFRLHDRPLELVCGMMGAVYKTGNPRYDMEALVDKEMRSKLEPGLLYLKTFHPYLPTLSKLFHDWNVDRSASCTLLLALVVYIATTSLTTTTEVAAVRSKLVPIIHELRAEVLFALPTSTATVQALEMLSFHVPTGVLPCEAGDLSQMSVGRGQVQSALSIYASLHGSLHVYRPEMDIYNHWDSQETWLWLNLVAAQAQLAIEEEYPRGLPPLLSEASALVERFLDPEVRDLWLRATSDYNVAELVGRLAICDRIVRLCQTHDTMSQLFGGLDTLAVNAFYDQSAAVTMMLEHLIERQRALESRHDGILSLIPPCIRAPRLTEGWTFYRSIRMRFENGKCFAVGLRCLRAGAFIPGHPLSKDGLITNLPLPRLVRNALMRSQTPKDIAYFLQDKTSPLVHASWRWGQSRAETCESLMVEFINMENLLNPTHQDATIPLLPMVDLCSVSVETTKILMEFRAGELFMGKSRSIQSKFRLGTWFLLMRQMSEVIARWNHQMTSKHDGQEMTHIREHTIPLACALVISSIVRVVDGWTARMKQQIANETPIATGGSKSSGVGSNNSNPSDTWPPQVGSDGYYEDQALNNPSNASILLSSVGSDARLPSSLDLDLLSGRHSGFAPQLSNAELAKLGAYAAIMSSPSDAQSQGNAAGHSGPSDQMGSMGPMQGPPGASPLDSLIAQMFGYPGMNWDANQQVNGQPGADSHSVSPQPPGGSGGVNPSTLDPSMATSSAASMGIPMSHESTPALGYPNPSPDNHLMESGVQVNGFGGNMLS